MNAQKIYRILLVLLIPLFVYACVSELGPATGERRYLGFSWQQEAEIGKQVSKEVTALFGVYRDAGVERYVTEIGNRVLATSHLRRPGIDPQFRNTPVTFGVLDSPIINAMALPGGYIYITRGMLAHLNNEDQLATVLAHEIGHVAARHAARQAWQQKIGQGLLLGGALIGQGLGLPTQEFLNLGSMAAEVIFRRYSREDELEADKLSVEYASAAGFDPRATTGLFETLRRIQEREGQGMPSFLSTHPDPGDRIQRLRQWTAGQSRRTPSLADSRYLNVINGLVLGEDPRQGFVEGNVFYHPDLRFRFSVPRGFRVINQPTQVVMVENQKRALLGFAASADRSLDVAASRFLRQPGLRIIERSTSRSDGYPAFLVVADAPQQNRQVVRVMAYFVEYRNRVFHFIGYAPPPVMGSFRDVFLYTMRSFGEIRDSRIANRQPVRLALRSVTRPQPLQDLIPRNLPAPFTPEDVATFNQVEISRQIAAGSMLKVPAAR